MTDPRGSRQSFLGINAQACFSRSRVGVIGLGGGGSHVCQQLAHIGFSDFLICDPDIVEDTNLNRLVGGTAEDAQVGTKKVDVSARTIGGLVPEARIERLFARWEAVAPMLRRADLLFSCLDGFAARRDVEAFARRHLIPLIDIGLDVNGKAGETPQMSGQVILSMPGYPCMTCLGFLNPVVLAQEAATYGDAGIRPQVIWGNGILASAAVGIAVDLLTSWTSGLRPPIYLEYDGNLPTLRRHVRLEYLKATDCPHYLITDAGSPNFRVL